MPIPSTGAVVPVTCCIIDFKGMYFQKWVRSLNICAFAPPSTCILPSDILSYACIGMFRNWCWYWACVSGEMGGCVFVAFMIGWCIVVFGWWDSRCGGGSDLCGSVWLWWCWFVVSPVFDMCLFLTFGLSFSTLESMSHFLSVSSFLDALVSVWTSCVLWLCMLYWRYSSPQ